MTAFGVGFAPHVQCEAHLDLRLRAHAIDVARHLALAPIAACHRLGRGRQPRHIETRQGFCQRGGTELLQCLPKGGEPLDASRSCGQCVEGGLGPTAPIEQRVYLCHDRTQHTSLGYATADTPQGLPYGCIQVTLDEERVRGEQRGALLCQPFFDAGRLRGRWRARAPAGRAPGRAPSHPS